MPAPKQRLVNLEEHTERHPQLKGRACPEVPLTVVARALGGAHFIAAGAFCRVWCVERWAGGPAAARGQPVVSAGPAGGVGADAPSSSSDCRSRGGAGCWMLPNHPPPRGC